MAHDPVSAEGITPNAMREIGVTHRSRNVTFLIAIPLRTFPNHAADDPVESAESAELSPITRQTTP
jgi:hypothetical protein